MKALSFLLTFACLILTTGCLDYIEMHNMLIVAGIGLDLNEDTGLYRATVELVNVQANGGENIEAEIVAADGDTIYSSVQNAMTMTGGNMYGNHCKVIVIGESLARQGINDIVDIVLRSSDFRKTMEVLVARGDTAEKILTQKTVKNDIVSYELEKILRSNLKNINNTTSSGMYELHEDLISQCPSSVIPTVSVKENNKEEVLLVEGLALFSKDRLKGFLNGEQCNIYNIATRKLEHGYLFAADSGISSKPIGAKITGSHVKYRPQIVDGELSMLISIRADIVLDGSADLNADLSDKASVSKLQKCFADQLSADTEALIAAVQGEYGVDIFDFYKEFENYYRNEWQTLGTDWQQHFREINIHVAPDIRITGSGLIDNYAPNQDESIHGNALP